MTNVLSTPPQLHTYLPLLKRALDIASPARIGVYDCLYVALAEREGCELATADDRLLRTRASLSLHHRAGGSALIRVRLQAIALPEADGGFTEVIPALGCATEGDSIEAAEGWLTSQHKRRKDEAIGRCRDETNLWEASGSVAEIAGPKPRPHQRVASS